MAFATVLSVKIIWSTRTFGPRFRANPVDISSLSESDRFNRISHLLEQSKVYSSVLQDRLTKEREAREAARIEEEKAQEASRDRKERREAREREKAKNLEKIADKKSSTRGKTRSSRRKNVLSKSEVQELDKSTKNKHAKKIGQPRIITGASMYDYQIHGIEWMASLYENGLNGILADEMGLGKTLQTIAFLAFLIEKQVGGPYLVVVPLSTLNNWENEFRKFAPSIPVVKFYGEKKQRAELWKGVKVEYEMRGLKKRGKSEEEGFVETFPVVITTYETVVMECRRLQNVQWKYLIVDEGHRIKNVNSLLLKKLKLLDTSNRLLLTGTPLQNNLTELWSLLNFLLPDVFSDLHMFQSWFDDKDNGANDGFGGENRSAELVETLHSILKPFLLRRLKSEVYSNLPDKREYLIYIRMAPLQEALENRLRQHARAINRKTQAKDTPEIVPEPLGKRVRKQVLREDVVDTFDADLGSDDDGYDSDESVDRDLKRQKKKEDEEEEEDYEGSDEEEEEEEEESGSEGEEEEGTKRRRAKGGESSMANIAPAPDKAAPLTQLQKDIIEGRVKWDGGKWVKKEGGKPDIVDLDGEEAPKIIDLDAESAGTALSAGTAGIALSAEIAPASTASTASTPSTALSASNSVSETPATIPSLQPTDPEAAKHAMKAVPHKMPPRNYFSAPDGNWYPLYLHPLFPKRKPTVAGMTNHVIGSDGFGKPFQVFRSKEGAGSRDQTIAARDQTGQMVKTAPVEPRVVTSSAVSRSRDRAVSGARDQAISGPRLSSGTRDQTVSGVSGVIDLNDPVEKYMLRLQKLKEKREQEEAQAAAERAKMDPVDAYVDRLKQLQRLSPEEEESKEDIEAKIEAEIRALREQTLQGPGPDGGEEDVGESREIQQLREELLGLKKEPNTVKTESEAVSAVSDPQSVKTELQNDSFKSGVAQIDSPKADVKTESQSVNIDSKSDVKPAESSIKAPVDNAANAAKPAKPSAKPAKPLAKNPGLSDIVSSVVISDSDSDDYASATENLEETNGKVREEARHVTDEKASHVTSDAGKAHVSDVDKANHVIEADQKDNVDQANVDLAKVDPTTEIDDKLRKEVSTENASHVTDADQKAKEVVEEMSREMSLTKTSSSTSPSPDLSPEITDFLSSIQFSKISTSLTLANLRKVANSPYLVHFPWGSEEPVDSRIVNDSGKMRVFDQLSIELLNRGHKILVFSQFSGTLDLLTEWCEFRNLPYCMLIGSMGIEERQVMIDAFNEVSGPSIFLITTRAGGTGINLTAADSVIIFDSDWNPQQDKQAIDRSHRIGQKRPCVIYRLISTNTMEEMLVRVATDKKRLDEMVIQAGDYSGFTKKDTEKTEDVDKTFLREIMTGKSDYEAHEGIDEIDGELMDVLLDRSDESYKAHREKTVELPKGIEVVMAREERSDSRDTKQDEQ